MSSRYFENRECEYYPCHDTEHMNCLFCFCPLYFMPDCGGRYVWIKNCRGKQIKDCSSCLLPHRKEGYDYILARLEAETDKTEAQKP